MMIVSDHRKFERRGPAKLESDLSLVEEILQLKDDFWDDGLLTVALQLARKLATIGEPDSAEALLNRASQVFPRFSEENDRIVDEGFALVAFLSKADKQEIISKVMERAWDLSCPGSSRRSLVASKILTMVDKFASLRMADASVRWLFRIQLSFPVDSQDRRTAFRCRLRMASREWRSGNFKQAIQLLDATGDIASYSNSERLILLRGHLQIVHSFTQANRFNDAVLLLSRAYLLSKPGTFLKRRVVNEGLKLIPNLIKNNEFYAIHLLYNRARICVAKDPIELRRLHEDYLRVLHTIEQSGQIAAADWMLSLALKDYPRDTVEYEQLRAEQGRVHGLNQTPDAIVKQQRQRSEERERVVDKIKTFLGNR